MNIRLYLIHFLSILFLCFFCVTNLFSQDNKNKKKINHFKENGIYPIENFAYNSINKSKQFLIKINPTNNLIYTIGNKELLVNNGVSWRVIYSSESIYDFTISSSGIIYILKQRDFGILKKRKNGSFYFKSLLQNFKSDIKHLGPALQCFAVKSSIFFGYREAIFQWSESNSKVYKTKSYFKRLFSVNNKLYFSEYKRPVSLIQKNKIKVLVGTQIFETNNLQSMFAIGSKLYFADSYNNIYNYDNSILTKIIKVRSEIAFNYVKIIPIDAKRFAIASRNLGLFIYSFSGELLSVINRFQGLFDNKIYDLTMDYEGGLWTLQSRGVSRIDISSPFSFFNAKNGYENENRIGFIKYKERYFCMDNDWFCELDNSEDAIFYNKRFKRIKKLKVDGGGIFKYKNLLIITTLKGVFTFDGVKFKKILNPYSLGFAFNPKKNGLVYISDNQYINIYKDLSGNLEKIRLIHKIKITNKKSSIQNIQIANDGSIWCTVNGYMNFKINEDYKVQKLDFKFNLNKTNHNITLLLKKNGIITFLSGKNIFMYNEVNKKIVEHPFDKYIKQLDFNPLILSQKNNFEEVFLSNGKLRKTVILRKNKDGNYDFDNKTFLFPTNPLIWDIKIDGNSIWFSGPSGWIKYDTSYSNRISKAKITFWEVIFGKDSIFFNNTINITDTNTKIPYKSNTFKVKYAYNNFKNNDHNLYQNRLEGFDNTWSSWSKETKKDYTNLPEGTYTFRVKAKNIFGAISKEDSYTFTILPPWYRTWWAYLAYILMAGLTVWLFSKRQTKRLEVKNLALEKVVQDRTIEIKEKNIQLKEKATKLKSQTKRLKELDTMKTRLFANISHEFRTPLTLIKGPIEKLEHTEKNTISTTNIKMIRRNANRLLSLVNQLLDLSKLDSGKLKLNPAEGDIFKCFRAVASSFSSHAAQREIDYQIIIPARSLWVSFDRDKIEKICYNLLSNAFKFTPDHGKIIFRILYRNNSIQILVFDTGQGIPTEKKPYIFDRFYQVDDSYTKEKPGSGIGLALTKELVDLLKGEISVESELGEGSIFKVVFTIEEIKTRKNTIDESEYIKISEPIGEKPVTVASPQKKTDTVLIVEDNNDMRHFIKEQLLHDYNIVEAFNGKEGLKKATKLVPNLIVTDLMMPQMDGITLCKTLKTNVITSHIPIVMLTAKAGIENKLEGLETGADDYLVKPFNTRELQVRVKNLIKERKKLRELFSTKPSINPKEVTVNSLDQQFLEKTLELLEEAYADSEFGVPQMQKKLGMSKTQLHCKLKALTNQPPGELLRNFRLKRAAQLLSKDGENISQIAYDVGFNSLSYFTKSFKKYYTVSPSEYIQKNS